MFIRVLSKKRIWFIFIIFFIVISLIYYKIIMIQIVNAKEYSAMEEAQYSFRENTASTNYRLLDCNGNDLSDYDTKYYAVIIPSYFKSKENTDSESILNLTYALRNYNSSYDISKIDEIKDNKLSFEIDEETYNKIADIKTVKGFYTYESRTIKQKSAWNIETMLLNPRKTSDSSFKDDNSIEIALFNKVKNNKYPQVVFQRDISGNIISESKSSPDKNLDVRLTIDKRIQDMMSMVLRNEKYKNYSQIGAVLMESSTGKILGMVQKEDTKPNVNIGAATENGFYPGSIFKVIVEEAALKNGTIDLNDKFTCRGFYEDEHKNHGKLTSSEAMVVSCNDIYAQIGCKTGYKLIYSMAEKQGILSKVIGFDSELAGEFEINEPKENDGTLSITSMGQGIRITPVEALSISNTVVNKGTYVKPYLIDAYVDKNNEPIDKKTTSSYTIFSKTIAEEIKSQMIDVVKNGTAKGTEIKGIETGGKTGTTERGKGSDGWFAGFFNNDGKYYSLIIFVENIDKKSESGGSTAAPIFKDIVNEAVKILK